MAKKKAAKKPPKKAAKKKAPVKAKTAPKPRPKNQPLPGMKLAKDRRMDTICSGIAETRAQLNDLRATEKGLLQNALQRLRAIGETVYKAHGVELARVPGDEKVRVRLVDSDEGGDEELETNDAPQPDEAAGDLLEEGVEPEDDVEEDEQ